MAMKGFIRVTITSPAASAGDALVNVAAIARLRKLGSGPRSTLRGTEVLLGDGTVFQVAESIGELTRAFSPSAGS